MVVRGRCQRSQFRPLKPGPRLAQTPMATWAPLPPSPPRSASVLPLPSETTGFLEEQPHVWV